MSNDPSDDHDLEDDQFWNLEQSDEPTVDPTPTPTPNSPSLSTSTEALDAFALPEQSHPTAEVDLAAALSDFPELDDLEKSAAPSSPSVASESESTHKPETPEEAPQLSDTVEKDTPAASSWSMPERLSVAGFFILLAILISTFVSHFFQQTTIAKQFDWKDTLPASGEKIHLKAAETQWKEASDPDVRFGVEFVPSITLTLSPKSSDGFLRVGFRNYDGKPVGDSKVETIRNGKFDNGTTQKTIHCTDGLLDEAALRGYLAQNEKRWSVHLKESASLDASLNNEKTLGQMSISPKFLDL